MADNFGAFLRKTREASGFGLNELARQAEMSPTFLSLVERGLQPPPGVEKLEALARLLNQQPDEFLGLAGKLPPDLPAIILRHPRQYAAMVRSMRKLNEQQLDAFISALGMAIEFKVRAGQSEREKYEQFRHWLLLVKPEVLQSHPSSFDPKPLEPWKASAEAQPMEPQPKPRSARLRQGRERN
jgi:HTH-type transcriptional regulator, competence development regulator